MRLTTEQLSMVLGNTRGHWCSADGTCRCVGAVALGYLDFYDKMTPEDAERARDLSGAMTSQAVVRGVEVDDLYATPDTLLGALEAAGLA